MKLIEMFEGSTIVTERTRSEWLSIADRLEASAKAEGKTPEEKQSFLRKAAEIRKKYAESEPKSEPVKDYIPDFDRNTPPRKYTSKGGFEPFPFKKGTKFDAKV